jgi:hypothetical protein
MMSKKKPIFPFFQYSIFLAPSDVEWRLMPH